MAEKKKPEEVQEIDVASLDSELAAARTLEEGKGDANSVSPSDELDHQGFLRV